MPTELLTGGDGFREARDGGQKKYQSNCTQKNADFSLSASDVIGLCLHAAFLVKRPRTKIKDRNGLICYSNESVALCGEPSACCGCRYQTSLAAERQSHPSRVKPKAGPLVHNS